MRRRFSGCLGFFFFFVVVQVSERWGGKRDKVGVMYVGDLDGGIGGVLELGLYWKVMGWRMGCM